MPKTAAQNRYRGRGEPQGDVTVRVRSAQARYWENSNAKLNVSSNTSGHLVTACKLQGFCRDLPSIDLHIRLMLKNDLNVG